MFGNRTSRNHKAERVAGQAWETLSAAVDSANNSTRQAGRTASRRAAGLFDDAADRVGAGTKEARRRANNAYDALAGRTPRTPWGTLAAVALVGAAFGWVATVLQRQLAPRRTELTEFPEDVSSELLHR